MRFDPKIFPNRTILIDTTTQPPTEKIGCLGCGSLEVRLFIGDQLCLGCYMKWQEKFREEWLKMRFGGDTRPPVT